MAFATKQVTLVGAATAVEVYSNPLATRQGEFGRDVVVTVTNLDATDTVHVGGSSAVDETTGFPVAAETTTSFVLAPGDSLYAFAETNNTDIAAAASGQ